MNNINQKFEQWAVNYSGMQGGNNRAKLWLCGIEYGGNYDINDEQFDLNADKWTKWKFDDGLTLPYCKPPIEANNPGEEIELIKNPYDICLAKIASKYYTTTINTWSELSGENGYTFKMNLYPLPFRSHNDELWDKKYYEKIGFLTKSEYKVWCIKNRFTKLKDLVNRFNPTCLICFGISLKDQYLIAFCDEASQAFEDLDVEEISDENQKRPSRQILHRKINQGRTLLMICPFPTGANGLNSDVLITKVAEFARHHS